ncbi:MAG: glutamate 5-kinase [Armatimonadota bacterium]
MSAIRSQLKDASRIVIKLGSLVVTTAEGEVDVASLTHLAEQVCELTGAGKEVVLITSGAIRTGRSQLGIHDRSLDLPARQAAAAVGQIELMWRYREIFGQFSQPIAQVLLTQAELSNFRRYLHLRNTLTTLLREYRVVPVLNENDSVSAEGVQIGENDRLAAVVASKLNADVLLSLSDVAGYFDGDPHHNRDAKLIPTVTEITSEMEARAADSAGTAGRGGMRTKVESAKLAMNAGVIMVIAAGRERDVIRRIMVGEDVGTIFVPKSAKMRARKRWIAYAAVPRGRVVVDEGAAKALLDDGKSLLPVGVVGVEGDFEAGAMVSVLVADESQRREIARGLTNYRSADLRRIQRCKSKDIEKVLGHRDFDEAIHRDNLVIL